MDRYVYDADGRLVHSEVFDLAAGTVAVTTGETTTTETLPPLELAVLAADTRATERSARLTSAPETLRGWATDTDSDRELLAARLGALCGLVADLLDERR